MRRLGPSDIGTVPHSVAEFERGVTRPDVLVRPA